MRSIDLSRKLDATPTPQNDARKFLYLLLTYHIARNSRASHIQIDTQNRTLLGQLRPPTGQNLVTVISAPDAKFLFNVIVSIIVRAAGLLPDSTSISQYDQARVIKFYAKTQNELVLFESQISMPKTKIPQVTFKIESETTLAP
jgi:hypothetical protein|tara:strand:+ start:56 stop:487 length:432 start_codon:yes stop_codon:yes gene_type:complete